METLDIVKAAVAALEDKKAEDVTVIDIAGVSSIADYFIIANGSNQNQPTRSRWISERSRPALSS